MLDLNLDELRAQVMADYDSLCRGVTDQEELHKIFDLIMDTTVRTMRDSMNAANEDASVARLPPEILGRCFALLSLQDAVRASHVSRSWRAVALSTPRMWCNIEVVCRNLKQLRLVFMALSRSGTIAHLKVASDYPSPDTAFDTMILPRMHTIRALEWLSELSINSEALHMEAPFLEYFRVHDGVLVIPSDFLDGRIGKLRRLICGQLRLPSTCPALSTVVDLRIYNLRDLRSAETLTRLFDLCPRLESLTLHGLLAVHSHTLPSGPTPESLRRISLETDDEDYDLTQHYVAWRTPNLHDVTLNMLETIPNRTHPIPLPLLNGAMVLSIRESPASWGTWLVTELPGARRHAIGIPDLFSPRNNMTEVIPDFKARFWHVHTINVALKVLEQSAELFAALPALRHVTVHLDDLDPQQPLPGRKLVCLDGILNSLAALETLVIDLWDVLEPERPIEAGIAIDILSHLAFLKDRLHLPQIRIRGLTADVVHVSSADLSGLPVHFDTDLNVGLVYKHWPFKESYDGFLDDL